MATRRTDPDESRASLMLDDRARPIEVYVARGLTEEELVRAYRFPQPRPVALPCACVHCDDVCMTLEGAGLLCTACRSRIAGECHE